MKRRHFKELRPLCVVCRGSGLDVPLELTTVEEENDGDVLVGVLQCSREGCQREYPILDGIPLLVADLRTYVTNQVGPMLGRQDLSENLESLIGDCLGPGSSFEVTRQHLSTYTWSHYGDLDPGETSPPASGGAAAAILERAVELAPAGSGAIVDLGCAVGRNSFNLAASSDSLVLGLDLSYAMLRVARRALMEGRVRYPRRRVGGVYDRRDFPISLDGHERVDFWAADALALPFADASLTAAACLNVLDCVSSPVAFLAELERALKSNAPAWLASPYDWNAAATPQENWLGGHSQRGVEDGGASEAALRRLLTPGEHPQALQGFEIVGEEETIPWSLRLHDRSRMTYDVHLTALRRR